MVAAFAAAGPLTHGRGFALLPPALLAVGLSFAGARLDRRTLVRLAAVAIGILLASIAVAALWTRARTGGQAFGGEVAQGTGSGGSIRQLLSYVVQFYFGPWSFLQPLGPPYGYRQMYIQTFFGSFVSLDVNWRTFIVDLLQIGSAIGLAAFFGTVLRRWPAVVRHWRLWALAASTFVSLAALLHISAYRDLSGGGTDPLLTGRYLLPCVALYALAIAWVCHSLPRVLGAALGTALVACSLLLAFGGIGLTGLRFYA